MCYSKMCRKVSVISVGVEIPNSKNSHGYSTHKGVKKFAKRMNTCDIKKSQKRGLADQCKHMYHM